MFPALSLLTLLSPIDYDQYYASLAASTNVSAVPTPGLSSESGDYSYTLEGASISLEEEEDKKPNVEYLESLNEYRKRSRGGEDVDGTSNGARKVAKTSADADVNGFMTKCVSTNGAGTVEAMTDEVTWYTNGQEFGYADMEGRADDGGAVDREPRDDPIVYGMHTLFSRCFNTQTFLSQWKSSIIFKGYGGRPRAHDTRRIYSIF